MELSGKTAIVTGAAKGIGRSCAEKLIQAGCKVVLADVDEPLDFIETENAFFFRTDITSEADVLALREKTILVFGSVDILINNAARQIVSSFDETTTEEFKLVIDTNLVGTFNISHCIVEKMKPGSTILNMLSVHYEQPRLNKFSYDASKAGLSMLTKEMALALSERNITVNAISYGAVRTPMNADWIDDPESVENVKKNIPLRWIATADEIAEYAETILRTFSDCATGSIFTIDGGRRLV